jgi:hypothetical protein
MAKIRLYGETSGYVELQAPDVAADNTVNLGAVPTIEGTPSDGQVLMWNASESKWEAKDLVMTQKKIAAFTANGTWTVPAGVTYAIAHVRGAGGGIGETTTGGVGGSSSVAFSGGTITAAGGARGTGASIQYGTNSSSAGAANSGKGAKHQGSFATGTGSLGTQQAMQAQDGAEVVAGDAVTPSSSITVTVGSGGSAGTNGSAGGSGHVFIEYYEAV